MLGNWNSRRRDLISEFPFASELGTTMKHYQKRLDATVTRAHNSWDAALTESVQ
jgi:hypothetical protein